MRNRVCSLCGLIYYYSHSITVEGETYFVYIDGAGHKISHKKGDLSVTYWLNDNTITMDEVIKTPGLRVKKDKK